MPGKVFVDGHPAKPGHRLEPGMRVEVLLPPAPSPTPQPEALQLTILFEDADLLVLNKPSGLVVHPGAGHDSGTLVNALLAHAPTLAGGEPFRPGIVHRLDRDTSGVMVVAKTPPAYTALSQQVRQHAMERRYLALAWGRLRRRPPLHLECPSAVTSRPAPAWPRCPSPDAGTTGPRRPPRRCACIERFASYDAGGVRAGDRPHPPDSGASLPPRACGGRRSGIWAEDRAAAGTGVGGRVAAVGGGTSRGRRCMPTR